jgi:hypothetical protein
MNRKHECRRTYCIDFLTYSIPTYRTILFSGTVHESVALPWIPVTLFALVKNEINFHHYIYILMESTCNMLEAFCSDGKYFKGKNRVDNKNNRQ